MKLDWKNALIIGLIGLLAVLAFFWWRRRQMGDELSTTGLLTGGTGLLQPGGGGTTGGDIPRAARCQAAGPPNCSKLLEQGVRGLEVCRLQEYMNANLPYAISIDGIFGPQTRQALMDTFQTDRIRLQDVPGFCQPVYG